MSLFSAKETVVLDVTGMHCPKCVAKVTEALEGCEGVTEVEVSLEDNSASASGHGLDAEEMIKAIEAVGFGAVLA